MISLKTIIVTGWALAIMSSSLGQPTPGTQLWIYETPETIYSSPAIGPDATIYVGAGMNLYALTNSAASVSNKWIFTASANVNASVAIGAQGTIFCTGGSLYAINPDGTQRWSFASGAGLGAPAVAADGTVYFVGANGTLFAVSPAGAQLWTHGVGNSDLKKSPTIGTDGTIYASSSDLNLFFAWNPDGSPKWQHSISGGSDSEAIGSNGTIYLTSVNASLNAIAPDGINLWTYSNDGFAPGQSPAIGNDGTLYIAGWESGYPLGYHVALRAVSQTGVLKWEYKPSSWGQIYIPPTPAVDSAGTVYFSAFNTLYAVSSNGKQQWAFTATGSATDPTSYSYTSPLIGPDGTIYVTFGSRLFALVGTNPPANTPWPMYRQNPRRTGKVEKPALNNPHQRGDANIEFELYPQQLGLMYTVQSSTNLQTWVSLTSFVANTFPEGVADLTATNSEHRFYRAFSAP